MTKTNTVTLNDIYQVVNRLEDKMDQRLKVVEGKVDNLESGQTRTTTILGVLQIVFTAGFSWIWSRATRPL